MSLKTTNRTNKKAFKGETVPLIDLCLAISDCPHYTPNWTDSGELVIRNFNIKNGRLDLTERYYTDKATFLDRIKRYKPESGDLIITREAPMGEVCIIPEGIECCLGQRMVLIKPNPKKVNNKYLLYAMLSEFVQKQIKKSDSSGSIVSNLCIPDLEELNIPYIPLTEQEKVASILNPIFESIEVNDRINTELENLAKTIYNYWFVQFDFPNEEGKPYKTSGGGMEWNEELKREIPKAWVVKEFKDLFDYKSESISVNAVELGIPYTPIDCLPKRRMSFGHTEDSSEAKTSLIQYSRNDILIGAMRVYFHRVCIAPFDGITRTTTIVLSPKNQNHLPYLYQLCNEERTIEYASNISVGTQQPYVNWEKSLEHYQISYPNDREIIDSYSEMINPIIEKIITLELENQELTKLSDFLLPLLMNGQVKVKSEAKEQLSMAAEPHVKYGK